MFHLTRRWSAPGRPQTPAAAAAAIVDRSFVPCASFRVRAEGRGKRGQRPREIVLLNDATGPDGMAEWAVCLPCDCDRVPPGRGASLATLGRSPLHVRQIESLTTERMTAERLAGYLERYSLGDDGVDMGCHPWQLHSVLEWCEACA